MNLQRTAQSRILTAKGSHAISLKPLSGTSEQPTLL